MIVVEMAREETNFKLDPTEFPDGLDRENRGVKADSKDSSSNWKNNIAVDWDGENWGRRGLWEKSLSLSKATEEGGIAGPEPWRTFAVCVCIVNIKERTE